MVIFLRNYHVSQLHCFCCFFLGSAAAVFKRAQGKLETSESVDSRCVVFLLCVCRLADGGVVVGGNGAFLLAGQGNREISEEKGEQTGENTDDFRCCGRCRIVALLQIPKLFH